MHAQTVPALPSSTQTPTAVPPTAGMTGRNWADIGNDDEEGTQGLVTIDSDGTKIVTKYFRENGNQMKCQTRYRVSRRVVRQPLSVKTRKATWKKFGLESLNFEEGDNKRFMTVTSTSVKLLKAPHPPSQGTGGDDDAQYLGLLMNSGCMDVPKRQLNEIHKYFIILQNPDPRPLLKLQEKDEIVEAYNENNTDLRLRSQECEDRTVRVTNLPEYTTEKELKLLFGRCGQVQRAFLAKNKDTEVSKGFAFITMKTSEEAARAIQLLHKKGFQNVLLNVEWTKRRSPLPTQSGQTVSNASQLASVYGTRSSN